MWIDKGKTILLNFLVITSLILSWLLLNNQPKYDYLHPAQYVERQPIGEKKDFKQLVKPQEVIFHYGNQKYTGATLDSTSYRIVSREMEKWYFFNMKKVQLKDEALKEIISDRKAIEIIYPTEIPAELVEELFTFRGKTDLILPSVKRILIYTDNSDMETYALFTDKLGNQMQARTAITSRDLEQSYLSLGNALPSFLPVGVGSGGAFLTLYIPNEEIKMEEFRYFFQPIAVSQMIQTLFVDPSLIRQVTERDGTMIYTDGSKAIRIPPNLRSIEYHDSVADSLEAPAADNQFHSVVNFINEHGGWNGDYSLEAIKKIPAEGIETFQFREYVNSYPFFSGTKDTLGALEVNTQHAYISGFNRSLINLDTSFDHQTVNVLTGQALLSKLSEVGVHLENVTDLFLGYQTKINENHIILSPKWIIYEGGKAPQLIDAKLGE